MTAVICVKGGILLFFRHMVEINEQIFLGMMMNIIIDLDRASK